MSNPLMEKLLGLPEFEVTDFKQNEYDMGFYVQTKEKPDTCPACGCYQPSLGVAKTRTQTIRDLNNHGKRVALMLKRRYYRCGEYGQIFAELKVVTEGRGVVLVGEPTGTPVLGNAKTETGGVDFLTHSA